VKSIIISPIITERSMALVKQNKFSFRVVIGANKDEIRKAVKAQFSVEPISIETVVQKGKSQRVGVRRVQKNHAAYKKAVVTLRSGQKIDIFDLGV
jgi:large subunit ribosomal protein L23